MCSALRRGELAANDARERSNSTLMVGPVDVWPDSNCRCNRGFQVAGTLANCHMLVLRPQLHQGGYPRMASLALRFKRGRQQHVLDCLAHQQHNTYLLPQDGEHVVQAAGTSVSSLSVAHITALEPVAFPTVSPTIRTPDHTAMQV